MRIIRSINKMSGLSRKLSIKGNEIGFVPTMGALHEGHLSLIRRARKENDIVVVSIFVNPIQFGPREDYRQYPRNLKRDAQLCKESGGDIIFYPDAQEMYPGAYKTYVTVQGLSDSLCGEFRPGHFKGVATVVLKLFNIVNPDTAYFGQKDAQQAIIIKKMAEDLNLAVKIRVMPTVREKDGLAISSRNIYLNKGQRRDAVILYQALIFARNLIRQGNANPSDIQKQIRRLINRKKSARTQYISIVNPMNLEPVNRIKNKILIALAVWIGKTRLIDNIVVKLKVKSHKS